MSEILPINTVIYYFIFSLIILIQQHYINWKDNIAKINLDLVLEVLLGIGTVIEIITGLIFLIYYAINIVWWKPIILFLITLLINSIIVGWLKVNFDFKFLIFPSILGYLISPICAYLMFNSI